VTTPLATDRAAQGARRLYVYYRVPEAELPATLVQVRALQAGLRQRHAGLHTGLLRRPELREGTVTLMETYAGLDAERLEAALSAALASLAAASAALPGPRHSEWFDELG